MAFNIFLSVRKALFFFKDVSIKSACSWRLRKNNVSKSVWVRKLKISLLGPAMENMYFNVKR